MTHDEMMAVLTAHRDGKCIEYRTVTGVHWSPCTSPIWSFDKCVYRVKPEPMVRWCVVRNTNVITDSYVSKEDAEKKVRGFNSDDDRSSGVPEFRPYRVVKMVEEL